MSKTGFLFLGALLSVSSLLAAATGCGGSGGSGTGGEGASGSTATAGTGGAPTLDCTSYCGAVMSNCTTTNAQFTDMASCMGVCAAYPVGALADTTGDTLGCRLYHCGEAKVAPGIHCAHAGPTGGDKDPNGPSGSCGEPCDAFCNVAAKICPTQYADAAACLAECKTFKKDAASYSVADVDTNDMGCRFYHLSAAVGDPTTHCPHIVAASAVCIK
jgi:hypothetical protein